MSFPTKDVELVSFAQNFGGKLSADPESYGTTVAAAEAFELRRVAFTEAYQAVREQAAAGIRNSPLVASKDDLKRQLLEFGRGLYAAVQFSPVVSEANKIAAGVIVRKSDKTPQAPPEFAPGMAVEKIDGRLVRVRVFNAQDTTSKARPRGTIGAMILIHVGEQPPEKIQDWTLHGPTGALTVDVQFPASLPPGTKVFLSSYWFNARKASGPACKPVSAVLNYPTSIPTAA
jgi:hypothetical protein